MKQANKPTYSVIVRNDQGASDGMVGTRKEINAWLRGWLYPEDLTVSVASPAGGYVGHKPMGRKTIIWSESAQ